MFAILQSSLLAMMLLAALPCKTDAMGLTCGEGYGDHSQNPEAIAACVACKGPQMTLGFDSSYADGIGFTACKSDNPQQKLCGEGRGDLLLLHGGRAACESCKGSGSLLVLDTSNADGMVHTWCQAAVQSPTPLPAVATELRQSSSSSALVLHQPWLNTVCLLLVLLLAVVPAAKCMCIRARARAQKAATSEQAGTSDNKLPNHNNNGKEVLEKDMEKDLEKATTTTSCDDTASTVAPCSGISMP